MNAFPGSLLVLAALLTACPPAAQSIDDIPTGFLTARIGGLPSDSWSDTAMADARRLVSDRDCRRRHAARAGSAGTADGPAMVMFDLAHVSPPPSALQSTQPPLVAVAGIDQQQPLSSGAVNRWYEVRRDDDPARAALRANLLLELLRATGNDVPKGTTDLPETASGGQRLMMPAAATLQAMQAAAAGRRRAETALLASMAIGEISLSELHPVAVGQIVRSVRAAGEDQAARLFAIEVAIAYGL
jgi:hypothetical protein